MCDGQIFCVHLWIFIFERTRCTSAGQNVGPDQAVRFFNMRVVLLAVAGGCDGVEDLHFVRCVLVWFEGRS